MKAGPEPSFWNLANVNSRLRTATLACFVAVLSYYAAKLGGALIVGPQADWPLWLGNVLLVSILLLVPRRVWPTLVAAAFAASFLYNVQAGLSIRSSAFLVLSDTAEVLTAALCLRYAFGGCASAKQYKSPGKVFVVRGDPPALHWSILRRAGRRQRLLDELEDLFFFGGDSIPHAHAGYFRLVWPRTRTLQEITGLLPRSRRADRWAGRVWRFHVRRSFAIQL